MATKKTPKTTAKKTTKKAPAVDPLNARITVAMITMNEEGAVGKVISDIQAAVPGAEILIVDSSKDRTPEIAEELGARVIRQFPPKGYGPAMDLALTSGKGDVVVTLDCDDTYPVEMIRPLARMVLDDGWDLVDGSRLPWKPEAMPWINYLANAGFALAASMAFKHWFTDLHLGMRAYRASMLAELPWDREGAALPVQLLLEPLKRGFKVTSIFIDYHERIGDSTMNPLPSAWWTAKRIAKARWG